MAFFRPFRNLVGLPPEKLDLLAWLLGNLKDRGGKLHNRLLRYLLDGGDDSVLGDLAAETEAAQALRLQCGAKPGYIVSRGGESSWGTFFQTIEPLDCHFYLRLGKAFEAAANRLPAACFFCEPWFDGVRWLEILLQEATRTSARVWSSQERRTGISGRLIEEMLEADGRSVDAFVTAAFRTTQKDWTIAKVRNMVLSVACLGESYAAHRDLIVPFLRQGTAQTRLIAVENLTRSKTPAIAFLEELVQCATDNSKMLREAAEVLLRSASDAARPLLEKTARQGDRAARGHAVRLLARICGAAARPLLESLETTEKSDAVKETIAAALNELGAGSAGAVVPALQPPAADPIPLHPPVTAALRGCLERLFAEYNQFAAEHNERLAAAAKTKQHVYPRQTLATLDARVLDDACRLLEQGGAVQGVFAKTLALARIFRGEAKGAYKAMLEHPDCQLIHAVRFLAMLTAIQKPREHYSGMGWDAIRNVELYRRSHAPKITLRHLAEAICSLGLSDDIVARSVLESFYSVLAWEPEAVWPFFLNKMEQLEKTFEPAASDWMSRYRRKREFDGALRVLATFPQVPPALLGKLWELAIGPAKSDRLRAQRVVVKLPDLQDRLAQALAARSFQVRAAAAEWLGRLGDRRAANPLHAAATGEKQDAALDEMLTALEELGESIEPYLDRQKLGAEAEKGLHKGLPPALAWFPWAGLPVVHWQDTGEEAPAQTVTWLARAGQLTTEIDVDLKS